MRIQAIRIKNLASLDGNTEIDFTREPLCSAGIFAITGPTGAGKSTILDALCLALYSRTPRYRLAEHGVDIADVKGNTIKQDDVRGILRDGTSNGYAEVDFIGIDGHCYRANWSVRRAYNKEEGSLQPSEMTLKDITSNQDIPGKKTELLEMIERLVGLNFEQFTRSVLLAQGDFTAFLKAGKDEKSSLLEKLTGTHIYSEISKKVFDHHREEQQKLRELNVQREGIVTLASEEINDLSEQKKELTKAIETNEKQRDNLQKEVNWHDQWSKLQESSLAAKTRHAATITAQTEAEPRKQHLQQIIRVQSARPIINSLESIRKQIDEKTGQVKELSSTLVSLQEQEKSSDAAFEQAIVLLKTKTDEEEQARPMLDKAKALDIQLAEKTEQVTAGKEDLAAARLRETTQKEQLSLIEKELKDLKQDITRLEQWKTENESRRPVAEQEGLILSKLSDAGEILVTLRNYTHRIQSTENDISKNEQEKRDLEKQWNTVKDSLQHKQDEHKALSTTLSAISIQEVENEKNSLDASIEELVAAEAHWRILYQAIGEKEALLQSFENQRKELAQSAIRLAESEKLLSAKKSERETSLKLLEKARMVAAENVERLRNQLTPGDECPVCGSTKHPYLDDHHPVIDLVLSELEKAHAENETAYNHLLAENGSIRQRCSGLEKTIGELEENISSKTASLEELENKWQKFPVSAKSNEFPLPERAEWLQGQLHQHKTKQQQLQAEIQSYRKLKEDLDKCTAQLAELDKQATQTENQLKDNERNLKSQQELLGNEKVEQQNSTNKLNAVEETLSVYFSDGQWFENWQSNPGKFVALVQEFARTWKTNSERHDAQVHRRETMDEKRKGLSDLLKSIGDEVETKNQYLIKLQSQLKGLSEERGSLFNGKPVKEVETKLKKAVDSAKQQLEEQRKVVETLQGDILRHKTLHEQSEKDLLTLTRQESTIQGQLNAWITQHNHQYNNVLTHEGLISLLAFSEDWIENERTALRGIDDAVMQANSILEERNKALAAHEEQRFSEKTLEELVELQSEIRELLKQSTLQANEIDFKVKEDETNKKRIGSLLKEIDKQASIVENWAKLNEVIGSADGKKFRQIAQEYTLDVLLGFANFHLEALSKRYLLQRIPNSLGLQVIDQDMGDEIRTVYSLSGGESFLVSLALALGLASLSSSRMKVESLFIDEGFGSLDPATLNIAMDALDRLHNQGRKVGVISHVQEMTERIPVQIKVSKQQSGKSKVEVIEV